MEANEHDILDVSQFEFEGSFDEQVQMLMSVVRMTKTEVEHLMKLFNDVERAFRQLWPNCKITPFGSVITGLGIKTSDVDIYASVPKHLYTSEQACVSKARNVLRPKPIFQKIVAIPKAKVPIIKFYHTPTRRNCDVNFKSPAGVRNSNLIAFLLQMDPRALPLTVLIKYWSKVYALTGTNRMPSYCLIMMVIFYLQQKSILPSVHMLQEHIEEAFVDGWNTAFNIHYQHNTTNCDSLYKLLGEFFVFYDNFNYENIISPFAGQILSKQSFKNRQAPDIFHTYNQYLSSKNNKVMRMDSSFCVQDPFEHNRNCAVAVFPRLAKTLQSHFRLAAHIYLNTPETEFLEPLLTESSAEAQIQNGAAMVKRKKKKTKPLNKNKHQLKNKVMKRTNQVNMQRDMVHRVYNNGCFPPHNNFHNR